MTLQLVLMGLAGLLVGCAVGAAKVRAPRPIIVTFLVMAGLSLGLSLALLVGAPT